MCAVLYIGLVIFTCIVYSCYCKGGPYINVIHLTVSRTVLNNVIYCLEMVLVSLLRRTL